MDFLMTSNKVEICLLNTCFTLCFLLYLHGVFITGEFQSAWVMLNDEVVQANVHLF